MANVSTYLNFPGKTEEAFNFYKSVFGGEFEGGIMRFRDVPKSENMPPMPEKELNMVMHVSLPINGGHRLMGTDAPESMGFKVINGNSTYIMLQIDTREETKRIFNSLSAGGKTEQELTDMFWGDFYGSFEDKYGIRWMVACSQKK